MDKLTRRARDQRGMTLIELLMAMSISLIITTMILVSWFALTKLYANTSKRDQVTDNANIAMARMAREVRDVEYPGPTVDDVAVVIAQPFTIQIYTTFNKPGNQFATVAPRLVMYRLYEVTRPDGTKVGELWRFQDVHGGDIDISGVDEGATPPYDPSERTSGEGAKLLVSNVVNSSTPSTSSPTSLFKYLYYGDDGVLKDSTSLTTFNDRLRIRAVEMNLLLDMNPGKSPVYTHMRTTAQLRNTR